MTAKSLLADFYLQHATQLRGYLRTRVDGRDAVPDLLQEVFVRLLGIGAREVHDPIRFAYRIARHLAIDHHRRERLRQHQPLDPGEHRSPAPDPAEIMHYRQQLHRMEAAIAELPPQCRRAFVLHRYDGLTQVEVASRMGISRQMAERHVARAMAHLRQRLNDVDH